MPAIICLKCNRAKPTGMTLEIYLDRIFDNQIKCSQCREVEINYREYPMCVHGFREIDAESVFSFAREAAVFGVVGNCAGKICVKCLPHFEAMVAKT